MKALVVLAVALCASAAAPLPRDLEATGFYALKTAEFLPQYPLWTDGMVKRRWIHLPAGSAIDKSDPDRWQFPVGTKLWKEFANDKGPNETRLIERLPDGSWRFSTYVWNADGTKATLAPDDGVPERGIPSRADCAACHEGPAVPVLGYSAVQLETKLAPALGYLHGNCGHCHNDNALPALDLVFAQRASMPAESAIRTIESVLSRHGRFRHDTPRSEVVLARMRSRDPLTRMPPLGVAIPDTEAIASIDRWIHHELSYFKETPQ
jgi:hypothetical protein